jgi:hypothetical protein
MFQSKKPAEDESSLSKAVMPGLLTIPAPTSAKGITAEDPKRIGIKRPDVPLS